MNNNKQHRFDVQYMRMAYIWAENSYANRRHVGCLIVKDKMIISDGYNGTPSGFPNVCEGEDGKTLPYVLHAEANAITKLARSGNSAEGATLYVTCEPCIECAKLIIQSGISRVVYAEEYHTHDGVELLEKAGITIEMTSIPEADEWNDAEERPVGDNVPCIVEFNRARPTALTWYERDTDTFFFMDGEYECHLRRGFDVRRWKKVNLD